MSGDAKAAVRDAALWFEIDSRGFDPLLETIGDAQIVLIGEASHGTHEFYQARAELTKALILRKGFNVIAVEADWPDAYRANRWVRHASDDQDAETAEQNARLVRNAEQYYRAMFGGRVESWNVRDTHMMESLQALLAHTRQVAGGARAVVWAHNSHLGDARATQMGDGGELNLGQLVRQAYGTQACLIGFSTHTGTVTAASNWDEPAQRKRVRPSLAGSYERLFHDVGIGQFLLRL